jgi:histidyl-tRNA synthetase
VLHSGGGSFKSQMKKADGSGAHFALIIGDDEAQTGQATLKPLRGDGEQVRVAQTELAKTISKQINNMINKG